MKPTREFRLPTLAVAASIKTDSGCVRETNEDNGRHTSTFISESGCDRGTLTIVADGMGGHSSGEIASEMAVDLISRYYYADETNSIGEALRNAIQMASAEIYESAIEDLRLIGMGTTVVALVIQDSAAFCAHVGDSRLC
jgi:serine/threonine protein phosphatase PrpC